MAQRVIIELTDTFREIYPNSQTCSRRSPKALQGLVKMICSVVEELLTLQAPEPETSSGPFPQPNPRYWHIVEAAHLTLPASLRFVRELPIHRREPKLFFSQLARRKCLRVAIPFFR